MWVLGVVVASLALPNYIARELFAALLLFSVLFGVAAALVSGAFVAWHVGRRFTGWSRFRNLAAGVKRVTDGMWFRTPAA